MRIVQVAVHTLKETMRERVFGVSLFFAVLLIVSSVGVSFIAAGEQDKVIKDVGLAAISIIGIFLAVVVGASLVHSEVKRKTIYTLLARPIGRAEYVVGKYLGMALTLILNILVMGLFFVALVHFYLHSLSPGHFAAIYLIGLELCLVAAFSVFFSVISTPIVGAFFTMSIYFVGHLVQDIQRFAEMLPEGSASRMLHWGCYLLPNLEYFNVKGMAVYGETIAPSLVATATLYGVCYIAAIVLLASVIFRRKDLK